ncbi:NAD/NADP octopine/nopaline dehydrogenase family protein [Cupriavidus sp. CV2]|uniref:NAD/NADP octopine/nopaline dehydrogenase family protein n=1 Tax=Cupriavidus ulmosensis TaxID=3065913 RepID=UPI00296A9946|nr:NAD/NADP octopine/nopaline dehydrogenase family protein [Cupriavidus sp. CV2]MDW3686380.1 NAD/NADP octopine/nopaline dehydrogenase family protein [Cupriavidus sp. CV2]
MKVAIVGAGNAGFAHAAKFSNIGHQVSLLKTSFSMHDDSFEVAKEQGGIRVLDSSLGGEQYFARINVISRDPREVIQPDTNVVLVTVQSKFHAEVADLIAPYLVTDQLVIVAPGYMGSAIFKARCKAEGVIFAEGESLPFDARQMESGKVNVLWKNARNALGFLPASRAEEGLAIARALLDTYSHRRTNIVESALHNPNLILHTLGTLMSASRIEYSQGDFWMYREAFTPSVLRLADGLDEEKNAVIAAYGGVPSHCLEEFKFRNEADLAIDRHEVLRKYARDGGPKGPGDLRTRYLTEDVPIGLGILISLAEAANIDTPISRAVLSLASALLGERFEDEARTLEKLGLGGKSLPEIRSALMGA